MVGYIQPKHLTLKIEFGLFIPFVNRRNADTGTPRAAEAADPAPSASAHQVELPLSLLALKGGSPVDR